MYSCISLPPGVFRTFYRKLRPKCPRVNRRDGLLTGALAKKKGSVPKAGRLMGSDSQGEVPHLRPKIPLLSVHTHRKHENGRLLPSMERETRMEGETRGGRRVHRAPKRASGGSMLMNFTLWRGSAIISATVSRHVR